MKIASFDIGIRNLAYCIIESSVSNGETLSCEITDWKIIPLCEPEEKVKKISIQTLCTRLITKLDEQNTLLEVDRVVLENQPCYINPKMKSVQMMIFTYFYMKNLPHVALFSPRNKLNVYDGPEVECTLKSKYSRTKFLGIQYCKYMIQHSALLDFFESHKKKDDLADSFLQGLLYLQKQYGKDKIEII